MYRLWEINDEDYTWETGAKWSRDKLPRRGEMDYAKMHFA